MITVDAHGIETMNAATVVLLRRQAIRGATTSASTSSSSSSSSKGSWQVLLGQNMVQNWLRSTPDRPVVMRYPGEWKFPGGAQDEADVDMKATALRELEEEFCGIRVPREVSASSVFSASQVQLYATSKKLTRPIGGRRFWMYNYVAAMEENEWIPEDVEDVVNANLTRRLETFQRQLSDGSFWSLPDSMKMEISPELRRVKWMDIDSAIEVLESAHLDPSSRVDEWQREQFESLGVIQRDPMYQSMVILKEVRALGSIDNFRLQQEQHKDW